MKFAYNLQYFADEPSGTSDVDSNIDSSEGDNNMGSDNGGGIDPEAFAEIISEKDKKLTELETEVKKLKRANADMLLKISASNKPETDFGQTVIDFCDTRRV